MPQAQTVALPKRLPLVLEPSNRAKSTEYDAKLVNAFMETVGDQQNKEVWIYERPGLLEASRPPAADAVGRGVFNWLGDFYAIFGDTLYKNGVAVSGTVDTTNGSYRFDSCMGATPKLQLGNGVEGYNYDAGSGLVAISDGDFPASFVKGWAFLDGTTYVMTPTAHILGDDINTPTDWDPANDILAQIEPDAGVALGKQLVYVIAAKQWTTEVFYDAGNATGSPLGRVEGAKINYGCVSADSLRDVGGQLMMLCKTKDGPAEVMFIDNLKAEIVSTKAVERLLSKVAFATETVFSWFLKIAGHRFYGVTCKTANFTLVFDIDERAWSQWTDTNGNYFPMVSAATDSSMRAVFQHESNGRLYYASMDYADDDGDLIEVRMVTPNFDGGTRREKQCAALEVISDLQPGSILQVRVNDYDYQPNKWSNWRQFNLGQRRPMLPDWGTYSRRAHDFKHREPVRMPRIQAIEVQIDLGTL